MKWFHRLFNSPHGDTVADTSTVSPNDLGYNLLNFSPVDGFTVEDATKHIHIFGGSGMGKTSSSGRFVAHSYLNAGYGGLILCATVDERKTWEEYCAETGRLDSLMIVSLDNPYPKPLHFNFLDYALARGCEIEAIVDLFVTVMKSGRGSKFREGEQFWADCLSQIIRNAVTLLALTQDTLSLPLVLKVINSAPIDPKFLIPFPSDEQLEDEEREPTADELRADQWRYDSFCCQCIRDGITRKETGELTDSEIADLEATETYWLETYAATIPTETRGSIAISLSSLVDVFSRGALRELFSTTTNIVPEMTHEGVILLIDIPVHTKKIIGLYAGSLFKYMWQWSIQQRECNENTKPCFLWADESQFFLSEDDQIFLTSARARKACVVYLSQNINNYHVKLGNVHTTKSMLENFSTKIFHANSGDTNTYASELVASTWEDKTTTTAPGGSQMPSIHISEEQRPQLTPHDFMTLSPGGVRNNLEVSAIIVKSGGVFNATGRSYLKTTFKQKAREVSQE